jgi:hypothetical protein
MTLRLLAAAAVSACLTFAAFAGAAGAFFKLSLPDNWPKEDERPACAAELQLASLETSLLQTRLKVVRFAGANAAAYLAGVKALFDVDLAPVDLLVIVEVMPQGASDPDEAVEIVFGFKDGCLVFRVMAHAAAHRKVLDWMQQHPTGEAAFASAVR